MAVTTIKVPIALRDALKVQARAHGRTIGEHLWALSEIEARNDRWEALRLAMAQHPIDDAYRNEASTWQGETWN